MAFGWPAGYACSVEGVCSVTRLSRSRFGRLASSSSIVGIATRMSENGHYRVRVPKAAGSKDMIWVEVPDDAVIKEPNKAGRTMVWPFYGSDRVLIRCFMPGSMI
jgi:hypothetical protein